MAANLTSVHYRLLSVRGLALPLAIGAGAFAARPLVSGLPVPGGSRAG